MTTKWHGERARFALASEGNPRQGRMTRHRAIVTATLMVLGLSAAAPAAAGATSLLSGYGGPGQGNQVILGSALLNTPGGGQGGGSSGAGGSSGGAAGSSGGGASGARALPTAPARRRGSGSQPHASQSTPAATPTTTPTAAVGSQPLGLSGADLLFMLLALAVIALASAITVRLARASQQSGGSAKETRLRSRVVK